MKESINNLISICHLAAVEGGWWNDVKTGQPLERNPGELIALMHSELSETLEGVRKNKQDDHLPHRKSEEVELADTLIRIFDYAGGRGLDLGGALEEKLAYNKARADHKPENRAKDGGKTF
jgi:NTP pyrophosphatase (non-canonical NTP hydrolase)